jgi:glutathione S-transferase
VPDYIEVDAARSMSGLRLVLTEGVPGPWGEAAKGIFHVKQLPFVYARQVAGGPNEALRAWTGQVSAPVAIWNDERPRSTWPEQLFLAERLAPAPRLVPEEPEDRALMFGYARELCGELGFGWCRRLEMIHAMVKARSTDEAMKGFARTLGDRYGYEPAIAESAPARAAEILGLLGERLERQRAAGSRFFIGDRLSALDIYWAVFAALVEPLPPDICPMPERVRQLYVARAPAVRAATTPLLMAHREFMYAEYLRTPLEF